MSRSPTQNDDESTDDRQESIHRDYVLDVRIVEQTADDGETIYRFEAPHHEGKGFVDAETAELYADVYFDVNGFDERDVGERGVPPEIVQAGRDTLVSYFLTWPSVDIHWIASFSGRQPDKVRRYVERLQKRAASIRDEIVEQEVTHTASETPEAQS